MKIDVTGDQCFKSLFSLHKLIIFPFGYLETSEDVMSQPVTLSELQIKRRELENELASLSQTEEILQSDLKTLEARIIEALKAEIQAKKSALNGLESRKSDLEQKLNNLHEKPAASQTAEEQPANSEAEEPVQQNVTVENDAEVTVVRYQEE